MGSRKKQRRDNPRHTHEPLWIPQLKDDGILERHLARKEAEERARRDTPSDGAFLRAMEREIERALADMRHDLHRTNSLFNLLSREDDVNACAMLIGGPMDGEVVELVVPREGSAPDEWWWPVEYGAIKTNRVTWHTRGEQDEEDEMLWYYIFDREEAR